MKRTTQLNQAKTNIRLLALLCGSAMMPAAAQAASLTWDNGTANFLWDTTSLNWSGVAWPAVTSGDDDAVFGAAGVGTVTIQESGMTANDMTFGTAGYTLTGGTLTLDGTAPSLTNDVAATINANLAGSSGLRKFGNGTLTLGGTNSGLAGAWFIAGATNDNNGGIVVQSNSALGGVTSIAISNNSFLGLAGATVGAAVPISVAGGGGTKTPPGAIRGTSGVSAVNGSVTLADAAVRVGNSGSSLTFNGPVTAASGSGYGLMIRNAANQGVIFTNTANYWEGNTTLADGSVYFYPGALPGSSKLFIAGSANAWFESSGTFTRPLGTTSAGQVDMASGYASGRIIGLSARGGDLTVNFGGASGTLTWGTTAGFNPGVLGLNGANATGQLKLLNGLDLNGATRTVQVDASLAELAGVVKNSSGTAAALTKSGKGVLLLSQTNTYNGGTTISGSQGAVNPLRLSNGAALGTGTVTIGSGGNNDMARLELAGGITVTNSFASFSSRGSANPNILNVSDTNTVTAALSSGSGGSQVTLQSDAGRLIMKGNMSTRQLNLTGNGDGELKGSLGMGTYGLTKSGNGAWTLSGAGTYSGGLTLNAGTLNLNSTTTAGAAAGTFTINGGTLDNTSAGALTLANNNAQNWNGDFAFTGTQDLNLGSGAVTLNTNRQVTVNGGTLTVGGAIAGTGFSLTKLGAGTLRLNGTCTYSGSTVVSVGTLALGASGSLGSSTNLTIASGATLDAGGNQILNANVASSGTLTVGGPNAYGTLTINGDLSFAGGAVNFDLTPTPASGNDQIVLTGTGTLNLSGVTTLNINFSALSAGTYPLVVCTAVGAGTLANLNPVYNGSFGRLSPSLQVTATGVNLVLTGVSANLTWAGTTNLWEGAQTALAWNNGTALDYFNSGDNVTFDATGHAQPAVLLSGSLTPGAVTVDTTGGDYSLNGSGKITGSTGLAKNGTGTLAINNTNDYSGGTVVNAGTLKLGDGVSRNGVVAGNLANEAAVVFANLAAQTFSGDISGSGTLTKNGNGTLTLAGANTVSGGITVAAGTLKQGSATALGSTAATTTVSPGATLDLGGLSGATNNPVAVSGSGVGGAGAVTSSGAIPTPYYGLRYVTLAGDTVFNTSTRWDIGAGANGGTFAGNGYKLTLVGTNSMSLNSLGETDLGDIVVSNQTLYVQGATTTLGRASNTVSVYAGSSLNLYGAGVTVTKPLALNGGALANGSGGVFYEGPITLNADATVTAAGSLTIHGVISGTNSLTTAGSGTTILAATNTFTGGVTNSAGTLQLGDGTATLGSVVTTSIIANGTVSFAPYTNQSFTGNVTGSGTLNKAAAGTLTLAFPQTNNIGLLRVSGGALELTSGTANLANSTSLNVGGNGSAGPATIFTLSGGTVNCASRVYVGGDQSAGAGVLNLNSGALTAPEYLMLAYGGNGGTVGSAVNVNGGTLTAGTIRLAQNAPGNGVLWLNGGVCAVNSIETGTSGYGSLYLNGGTLQARSAQANFIKATLAGAYVSTNTSTIDNAGFGVGITQGLAHDPNAMGTDGGLRFVGSGTTTLAANTTYNGPTAVAAGKLVVSSQNLTGGGALALSNATLSLTIPSYYSVSVAQLGVTNSTLELDYGTTGDQAGNFTAINVSGDYAAQGTNTIVIKGNNFADGATIVLVQYSGNELGTARYVLAPMPAGHSGTLVDDTLNKRLVLTVNTVPASLTWKGTSGTWDTNNAANQTWVLSSDLFTPASYGENLIGGPVVTFDDNVAGGITDISLGAAVKPLNAVANNNYYNYSLTGAGKMTGQGAFTKSGTATFVLGTANDYTGGTVLVGGTLQLTNGANRLPPGGALTFAGNSLLDLGGNGQDLGTVSMTNTITGTSTVSNGTVTIAGPVGIGATSADAFATLDMHSLDSLTMNQPASSVTVGGSYGASAASSGGEWFLPRNSALTVKQLSIAPYGAFNAGGITNLGLVHLGQSASINADLITLGTTRAAGLLDFAPGLSSPAVTIRNTNAANSRVSQITVGQNGAGSSTEGFGLVDFNQGSVDARASNLVVGVITANSAALARGTVTASNGTVDVLNLTLGRNLTVGGTGGPNGTFNQNSGTNKVQTLTLGENLGLTGTPKLTGTYNLNGGTLLAQSITAGTGAFSTSSTRRLNWADGTLRNYDAATDLVIDGVAGTGGQVSLVLSTNGFPTFQADAGRTITVGTNVVISQSANGPATLVKAGPGTLLINGANNQSLTVVSNGTLGGFGSFAGGLTVQPGATLSPGASIGTLTVNGNVVLAGNLLIEIDKSLPQSNDVVVVGGSLTNAGVGTLTLANIGTTALAGGDTFKLFNQALPGGEKLVLSPVTPGPGLVWTNNLAVDGSIGVVASAQPPLAPVSLAAAGSNAMVYLTWSASPGATSYTLKRGSASGIYSVTNVGITASSYADTSVVNGYPYFYVVSAVSAGGESGNSPEASAIPVTTVPCRLTNTVAGGSLTLSWPTGNLGWVLLYQTNALSKGIYTNWQIWPNSTNSTSATVSISKTNPTVFFRLSHP